jgi:LAO/AO transport system kinase
MTDELPARVRSGDVPAVARALSVVENDLEAAAALLEGLFDAVGRAHRVGVTGPPGAGKSTLIAALAKAWREDGRRVGILAVDPSSPFTGGALLGDRVRMMGLFGDAGVFIRSLATRGALGGLSRAVHDGADVLDAAGFDPVVVETVGVGQSELAIAGAADTVVVVVAPGSGDGVQAMKAGLLEVADLIVVNQSDREGADRLLADLRAAVDLRETGAKPAILSTTATGAEGDGGVGAVKAAIDAHRAGAAAGGALAARRAARAAARIRDEVDRRRSDAWWPGRARELERLSAAVAEGRTTAAKAAGDLLRAAAKRGAARGKP